MLKNAYVFFEDGSLRVKFQLKTGGADRFGEDWHEVKLEPGKPEGKEKKGEQGDEAEDEEKRS